jgi:epsilon-lactone hydrolase
VSIQLFLLDRLLRLRMKRRFARDPDVLRLRPVMEQIERMPARVPRGVRVEKTVLGGVPTQRLTPEGGDPGRAVLYIHGGGFVTGSPRTYRAITGRLAAGLGATVHAIDYRLAPEHPFPAALDDVIAAYGALLERGVSLGRVAIAGDSAGGNLTLAGAIELARRGTPMPGALVALSPMTDLSGAFPSRTANAASDAAFDPRTFRTVDAHYCPGLDPFDPRVSPWRGDVRGLPPTLIQCSEVEMLRDDGIEMARKLEAAGVPTKLEVWPKAPHVWQLAADFVPEARRAIEGIIAFLRERI